MVGIVILNYNNSQQTLGCVASLRKYCTGQNWKLCVVDNASREQEYQILLDNLSGTTIIRSESNGGYARGNDLGCEFFAADPQVDKILILNDDTRFTMDIITPMEEYLDTNAGCAVVFPKVLAPDGSVDRACWRHQKTTRDLVMQAFRLPSLLGMQRKEFLPLEQLQSYSHDKPCTEMLVPPGSCMMLPKAVFQKTGWLDPNTFLYFEEHILCAKLQRLGLQSALLEDISIIHLGAQTTKKQPSKAVYRHWRRSYLYFITAYTNICAPLRALLRFRTWFKTI